MHACAFVLCSCCHCVKQTHSHTVVVLLTRLATVVVCFGAAVGHMYHNVWACGPCRVLYVTSVCLIVLYVCLVHLCGDKIHVASLYYEF